MRTTLEMLRRNEREPPRFHAAMDHLGEETIPSAVKTIVGDSQATIVTEVMAAQGKNEDNFSRLHQDVLQTTTEMENVVARSQKEVLDSISEKLACTDRELRAVKEALSVAIPEAVGGIVGDAHQSSLASLSEQIKKNADHSKTIEKAVHEELPGLVQGMLQKTQSQIMKSVEDMRTQLPEMVESMIKRSQTDTLITLTARLEDNTGMLRKNVARDVITELSEQQEEINLKLDFQLQTILDKITALTEAQA